jgi:DNA polymerase/3'-5' exonuclease PolX
MAIVKIGNGKARRLDLLLTPEDEYSYALLYFTGSGPFNVVMRQYALEKGYSLNEHRMIIVSNVEPKPQAIPDLLTEKEIFDFLKIPYIKPADRTPEDFEKALVNQSKGFVAETNTIVKRGRGRPKKNP